MKPHPVFAVPPSSNVRGAEYPRVLPDNRVLFPVEAPSAQSVTFRADKTYAAERCGGIVDDCDDQPAGAGVSLLPAADRRREGRGSWKRNFPWPRRCTSGIGDEGDFYGPVASRLFR